MQISSVRIDIYLLLAVFLFSGLNVNAQSKSNKGRDFWVGFMKHKEGSSSKTSQH